MIYDCNGEIIQGTNLMPNMINEMLESFNEISILLEKESIIKAIMPANSDAGDISIPSDDIPGARISALGKFDEEKAKLILESENICEEYKAWCEMDFERLKLYSDDTGVENFAYKEYQYLLSKGHTPEKIYKYIFEEYYQFSDDPEDIKSILNLRLHLLEFYKNVLKKSLNLNYKSVGLSQKEARYRTKNIDIKEARDIILSHSKNFIKRDNTFYDLRSLGFGVTFLQDPKLANTLLPSKRVTLSHLLNKMIINDIIIVSHGFSDRGKWLCNPVYTENGGPFASVEKLVEQCIKESKQNRMNYDLLLKRKINILLMICNPGGHKLPDSIISQKDVNIRYATSSVLFENSYQESIDDIINNSLNLLDEFSNRFDLNDIDNILLEEENISARDIWKNIIKLIKQIINKIINLFKNLLNFAKSIIDKIMGLIYNNKYTKISKVPYIYMESVESKVLNDYNFLKIKNQIERSCIRIVKNIQRVEKSQLLILEKIQKGIFSIT